MSNTTPPEKPNHAAGRRPTARQVGRLRRLGICVPASLVDRAGEIAATRRTTRNAVLKLALERGIGAPDPDDPEPVSDAKMAVRKRAPEALEQMRFRIGTAEKRRIEAFALRKGYRDASSAIADLVTAALDDHDLGENVPATKAEELEQSVRELRDLLDHVGPGVLGILGLLAHWATQSGGLDVEEDELIQEALTEGRNAWALRQEIAAEGAAETSILDDEGDR